MIMIVFVFASCQEELEFEDTETAQTPPNVLEQKNVKFGIQLQQKWHASS